MEEKIQNVHHNNKKLVVIIIFLVTTTLISLVATTMVLLSGRHVEEKIVYKYVEVTATPSNSDDTTSTLPESEYKLIGEACQNKYTKAGTTSKCELTDVSSKVLHIFLDCSKEDCKNAGYGKSDFYITKAFDGNLYIAEDDYTDDAGMLVMTVHQLDQKTNTVKKLATNTLSTNELGKYASTKEECAYIFYSIDVYNKNCFDTNLSIDELKIAGQQLIDFIDLRERYGHPYTPICSIQDNEEGYLYLECNNYYDSESSKN